MKRKIGTNIILIFSGLLLIGISLGVGLVNNFSGERDWIIITLSIGVVLLVVGIAFAPKIRGNIVNFVDMVTMFFDGIR